MDESSYFRLPAERRPPKANRAKQSQFRAARLGPQGKMCETKPNLGGLGYLGKGRSWYVGRLRRKVECAKQTQFSAGGRCHPPGGGCAEQTQFPAHRISQHSTALSFRHSSPMPIVQNEPNFRRGRVGRELGDEGRTCKTNPILPVGRGPGGRNAQNKPNFGGQTAGARSWLCKQTQLPAMCRSGDRRSREPSVPNKANLSIADWRRTSDRAANCAKRTQFGLPPRGRGGRNVQNEPNSEEAGRRGDTQHSTIPVRRRPSARRGQAPVPALWKGNHRGLPLRALAAATHGRGLRGGAGGDLAGLWPRRSMTIMARGQDVQGPGGFHW
jgi:hypothetical protein